MHIQSGLLLLEESLSGLPEAEQKIAKYILENPERFITLSITEVAEECGSSIAAVVRLCKRLGINGYKDLKIRVTWDISKNKDTKTFLHIEPGLSAEEISRSIVHNNEKVMEAILQMINVDDLVEAAKRIYHSERVDIYGVGASGIVALDLYQKLLRIGIRCSYTPDTHLQITSACGLTEKDCVVAISYSGETPPVIQALNEAKKSGAYTISLTRFGNNTISGLSDLKLYVPFAEPLIREGAMTSRISQLVMIDIIFSIMASNHSKNILSRLERTSEALKPKRD